MFNPQIVHFATLSYVHLMVFSYLLRNKKSPRGLKLLFMVLQDNSFKTLVLILHQNAALFLSNNPWSELSDFFCTLNCGDKNLIIAITTISRFTSVFINFPKVLPNEREISNQLLTS